MNVAFKSIIKGQGKEDQVIEFTDQLELTEYNGFQVYEFKEPSMGVQNRIEISDTHVNIFAGPSAINLELGNPVNTLYETEHGPIQLIAHMTKLDSTKENPKWTYTLASGGNQIGEYNLSLEIK